MASIFDNATVLPSASIQEKTKNLVRFEKKFNRIYTNLKLLLDQEGLINWSKKFHNSRTNN